MTYGTVAGRPPWLSQRESQVPRVMHYTERWIKVCLCYLFDKLEFVEQYFEICYNQLRILEFIVHQYFYKKVLTFTLRHSVGSVSGGGKIENAD